MKWITMLLLTTTLVSCAHHFRDRQISSVDEKFDEQSQRRQVMEARGAR